MIFLKKTLKLMLFLIDIMINKTRCLINPAGYFRDREGFKIENEDYKNDLTVEI